MKNEVLVWVAGELGLSVDAYSVGKHKCVRLVYNGMWVRFDLEGDMPINAWLREKVVEWIDLSHSVWVMYMRDLEEEVRGWTFATSDMQEHGYHAARPQAILAAVQWVYDHRDGK